MTTRTSYRVTVDGEPIGATVSSLKAARQQAAQHLRPGTLYVVVTALGAVVDVRRVPAF